MKTKKIIVSVAVAVSATLSAQAQQTPATAAADEALEEIVIFSRGIARQQQSLSSEQIAYLPAGTSPLKAIEKLPGVNFQAADPFGAYEWSTRIVVRGFNQNQMGFTLDGIPLGDMSYGNHNGLHISRAIPSELVGRVSLSQGAGALGTASTSNLGGTIGFSSVDPADSFGARIEGTTGSEQTRRYMGVLDTGALGEGGPRAYLAAIDSVTDKWKGEGEQQQRLYTLKVQQPIGDSGELTAYFNRSERAEADYQDMSYDIIRRRGANWDNFAPNWDAAVRAAVSCAASGFSNGVVCDDAYWDAAGIREDQLGYVGFRSRFSDDLSFDIKAYVHQNEGMGLWGTPYVSTPGGAPLTVRTTEYDIDRKGLTMAVDWVLGEHAVEAGVWLEKNDFQQARRFYPESNLLGPTQDFTGFLSNPLLTQWEYAFETKTTQFHIADTYSVSDALKVNFGFKSMKVENTATTIVGPAKSGTIDASEGFLPQIGFAYALAEGSELFGQYARNARAFVSANTAGPFSTTAAGFAAIKDSLQPETSSTFELGWRFRSESLEGSLTAYHVGFDDRLLAIQQGPGIVGNPSVLANVGGVTTNGVEAALNFKLGNHLSLFASAAWNDSTFDDDYVTNGVRVGVSGKTVPDAPKVMFRGEVAYDDGNFFAKADVNYVGERYYTFLNQGSVDAYTLLNASVGYRLTNLGFVKDLTVQASVTNATDELYISTVGSNGFVNADPNGTTQTLLVGAPQQYFVSLKARF
ncbi:MAG: TonB-dependent receptor [Gammaproteobacteria bacterium]|jgi:iron complex outermembrane receptor protein|nr:TonB-dependent receptor [Gammaproteobacteria bacterium]